MMRYKMAELHPESARDAARKALSFAHAFNSKSIDQKSVDWQSNEPWPRRIDLAIALDHIEELSSMVLNLADRVQP
jgi:hypothetical protein